MAYAEGGYDSRSYSWGTGESRCYVSASISTTSDTQCYVSFEGAVRSGNDSGSYHRISGYGVTCTVSTSDGGSASNSASYDYANWVAKASGGVYVTRTGSDRTITVTCSYSSYNGASNSGSVSVTLTVPHRVWYQPRPPKNCAIARSSDTSQKLTWEGDYTGLDGGYPWLNVYVERCVDGGSWSRLATLSWSAVNYTDSSTSLGHKYEYRLQAYGQGGTSSYTSTLTVYTTPAAFTGITCSKPTTTTVKLTPTTAPKYMDSLACQATTDNGATWEDVSIDSGLVIADPPKGQCRFRLAAVKASGGTSSVDLQGAWCESDTIATLCAPYAPYVDDMPVVVATGTKVAVSWTPNHPDGTAQSKAQVKVTKPDGTSSTTGITGATTTSSFTASDTGTYQVQVRTYGEWDEWGEWSTAKLVRCAVAPVLAITAPASGKVIDSLPIAVSWTYTDETGMAAQTLAVSGAARAATTIDVPLGQTSLALSNQVSFLNGTDYTLTLSVTAGSGLVATASVTVSIDWAQPDEPDVAISYDAARAGHVAVTAATTGVAATSFDVSRVLADGSRLVLAEGLASGQAALDRLPPLNEGFTYVVSAYAASGAVATFAYATTCESDAACVNFGAAATECDLLRYDPSWGWDADHDAEALHMLNGSDLPVPYRTGQVDVSRTYSATMPIAEYEGLREHCRSEYVGWVREYDGGRVFGVLALSLSRKMNGWATASLKLTECAWEEPANG